MTHKKLDIRNRRKSSDIIYVRSLTIIQIRKCYLQKVDNANAEKCAKVWNNQLTAQQPKKASHVQKVAQKNFSRNNYFMKVRGFGAG